MLESQSDAVTSYSALLVWVVFLRGPGGRSDGEPSPVTLWTSWKRCGLLLSTEDTW